MFNGLINVYKEPGYTSFDVVAKLRGILKQKKIGHTGTLDPAAEGVLLVCLGNGTKLCDMLENHTKTYRCEMLLGKTTDTEDDTGVVLSEAEVNVTEADVIQAVNSFIGEYAQIPPMYSALKQNGVKLYELARKGITVERKPRNITIFNIDIEAIELPLVTFSVSCSKGTYIRSLCRDIGEKLGCGAVMKHLIRTESSGFMLSDSLKLSQIESFVKADKINNYIISVEKIFLDYKSISVKSEAARIIDNGNPLTLENINEELIATNMEKYRVYNSENRFVAIYTYKAEKQLFMPEKMFL